MALTGTYSLIIHPLDSATTERRSQHYTAKTYGTFFITIKNNTKKHYSWDYYADLADRFRPFGDVIAKVIGPDSKGKPHLHFIFHQTKYYRYNKLKPKGFHINVIPFQEDRHLPYMRKHKLL